VAIAWALSNRAVTAASVGARRPHQLHEVVRAASLLLSRAEIETLNRLDPGPPARRRRGIWSPRAGIRCGRR
jgi:aryl-alcohol dehydrogenase-like predicted oxidoreductase